jgi:glycosyltransferase involved in cell wall biosynthesis
MSKGISKFSQRLRIAFVIPLLRGRGGWSTSSIGIINSLKETVDPVLIVSTVDESAAHKFFPGVETHILPELQPVAGGTLRVMARMAPTILALRRMTPVRADLVHSLEMFPCGWVGDAIAGWAGAPHVLTAHGTYGVIWYRWPVAARLYSGVLRRASCICPVSNGTAERMRARFPDALASTRIEVVLQGSEYARRVGRDVAEGKRFTLPPLVLSVGALKPRKGYPVSLRGFAVLQRKFPDSRYVIIGAGASSTYHRELLALVEHEGIRNVEFRGMQTPEQLDRHYRDASFLVMASQEEGGQFEGFGFVFLEAGAYGLPVIGTRTGGIPDAVVDGGNGFLLPADDAEGIGQAMIRLTEDTALARRMGMAGRARTEELTWERYARQQSAIYQRALAGAPAAKSGK